MPAMLTVTKTADKNISYIGDIITYRISLKNSGNVPADNISITDIIQIGAMYVPNSLTVNVPYTGTLSSGIMLSYPVAPNQTVAISFKAQVSALPNPNPLTNQATASYTYTVDPSVPDVVSALAASNVVSTLVFRFNFAQQINDLIESVALEEAALAAIADAEGAKIQKVVAMEGITSQELLCLNRSVSDMMESLSLLESVLRQKLGVVDCQINGSCIM